MLRRHPFLFFGMILGVLLLGALLFVQSTFFAGWMKGFFTHRIPSEWGIQGDFSDLRFKVFPPGLSIRNPQVTLQDGNIAQLPGGSKIQARSLDLIFYPLQMFTGRITVSEIVVREGKVELFLDPKKYPKADKKKQPGQDEFRWEDLFQVRTESIALERSEVILHWPDPQIEARFIAERLGLSQTEKAFVELELDLRSLSANLPESLGLPNQIQSLRGKLKAGALSTQIESLDLEAQGLKLHLEGELQGALVHAQALQLNSQVKISGEIEKVLSTFALEQVRSLRNRVSGELAIEGKLSGDLLRFNETFKVSGRIAGTRIRALDWSFDKVELDGEWQSATKSRIGEISVTRGRLESALRERQGGRSGASGGVVGIGAFRIPLDPNERIRVPLMLEAAHVHWLAGVGLKDVYPLDFRASGAVDLRFLPAQGAEPWRIDASLDLKIPQFQLDNQKLGVERPLREILKIPEVRLFGEATVLPTEFRPSGLKLYAGEKTELELSGKMHFKDGWDLLAKGALDFRDLKTLARTPIRGAGTIGVHVLGPGSAVKIHFDADFKETEYVSLGLGDLKGRITYDDALSQVIFQKVQLQKGVTSYVGDGRIELAERDLIGIDFDIKKGDIHDLSQIFHQQTGGLWWFPSSLTGPTQGKIRVSGELDLSRLNVESELRGLDWDYFGEKFRSVNLKGGYYGGAYRIDELRGVKNQGKFSGMISFSEPSQFNWQLQTEGWTTSDFDRVTRLNVPIRGLIDVSSRGQTQSGWITSQTQARFSQAMIRGVPVPESELSLSSSRGILRGQGRANGAQAELDFQYDFNLGQRSSVSLNLQRLDFSPLFLILNPKLIDDRELLAVVSGGLKLDFESGNAEFGSGRVFLDELNLSKKGSRFTLARGVSSTIQRGSFQLRDVRVRGQRGELGLNVTAQNGVLDGNAEGSVDLSFLEYLTSVVSDASGLVQLTANIGGTLKEPNVSGRAVLQDALIRSPSVEAPFESISGTLQLRQGVVQIRDLRSSLGGGSLNVDGKIEVFPDRFPKLELSARLSENRLKIYPFQFVRLGGNLKVTGESAPYLVDGSIRVEQALSRENISPGGKGQARRSARFMPQPSLMQDSDYPLFRMQIRTFAERGVFVKNDLFDAELKGDLTLLNTIQAPRLAGTAELLSGKMSFKDRTFVLESGKIQFDNPTTINPKFTMAARADVKSVKITLFASGDVERQKIDLNSDPVMPESEILSLLAIGFRTDDIRRFNQGDASVLQQGEAASLVLDSLGFTRDVKDRTGFEVQLQEAVDGKAGTSIFRPQAQELGTQAAPKIVIKRQIGKKVGVSVGSTVGVGNNAQQEGKIEIEDVVPGVSVIGVWNSVEGTGTQESQSSSYGVDLKFEKKFK
jgi:hypothetical protein